MTGPGRPGVTGGPGAPGRTVIGVALAVPAPHAGVLEEWRRSFGDPLAAAIPAHVTLLPPTSVPEGRLAEVGAHLGEVARRAQPFTMRLRGTGTFRPVSPVVFVQVSQGLAECELLEKEVRSGVLERDLEFAYHPHVTVAHHLPPAALDRAFDTLADFEAVFTVDAFGLYRHGDDGVWRVEQELSFSEVAR